MRQTTILVLYVSIATGLASAASGTDYTMRLLGVPDSTYSVAYSINDQGIAAVVLKITSVPTSGMLQGTPHVISSQPSGATRINNSGQVLFSYADSSYLGHWAIYEPDGRITNIVADSGTSYLDADTWLG